MKKITTFYIHHKVAAFFTALWLIFMVYIAITGFQKDNSHIIAGLVATLVMFVPGAVIIALVCAIISSIARTFSGIIKANSTDSNDVEPIIPSYSKSDHAPESASEPWPGIPHGPRSGRPAHPRSPYSRWDPGSGAIGPPAPT